tara:strand:+ start:244 stop:972 length:729 start_codon:yes stop_codon:yes gene_type:complete
MKILEESLKNLFITIALLLSLQSFSQELNGVQLLEKAIKYHDPNGSWSSFNDDLLITMESPEKPNRDSEIFIDIPNEYFRLDMSTGKHNTIYIIDKDSCSIEHDGTSPTKEEKEKYNLTCERAKLFQNYYTYLYGLPMKLKDPGTIIHDNVESKTFKGQIYWVLKATYEKEIGKDIWYFYFNKNNYKMEVYQFFHDESKNDGEYILLTDEEIINNIKMPKIRAWYTNKDNEYLGTDILKTSN